MHSIEAIKDAARRKGHTEEEVQRIIAKIADLKRAGLIKTSGNAVALTVKGSRTVADLKTQGKIPSR